LKWGLEKMLNLRPETEHDAEISYRVFASTRLEEMALTGWPEPEIERFLRSQFDMQTRHYRQHYPGAEFTLICQDELPVGRLYLHRSPEEWRLMDIALLTEYRRQGIGRQLLQTLLAEADQKKMPVTLHVEMNNPILPYYQRLGFQEVELRGIYWYMQRPVAAPSHNTPAPR
jgi:ribosomal protein S18 acetylase RimI-like enzyme